MYKQFKRSVLDIVDKVVERYLTRDINRKRDLFYKSLRHIGNNCSLPNDYICINPKYISIGDNFNALRNLRLEAWDQYAGEKFSPEILIGNNVNVNSDVHIGCINKVVIGDNVLMASHIYISDHSHGEINSEALEVTPAHRKLFSKGPVIIENNVWIGEGVCVLPGVTIGQNSIVGANAVVTANIPKNSVAGGIPARVLRTL